MLKDYASGCLENPEYLVIFLHEHGGNGENTAKDVERLLSPILPKAKIICPDAPWPAAGNDKDSRYREWFYLEDLKEEDRKENPDYAAAAQKACYRALEQMPMLDGYISDVIKREQIHPSRIILAGFSQGATMAVYVGLLSPTSVAGIFSISGGAIDQLPWPYIQSKTPVLMVIGAEEKKNSYSGIDQLPLAKRMLDWAGIVNDSAVLEGVGHYISPLAMKKLAIRARELIPELSRPNNSFRDDFKLRNG